MFELEILKQIKKVNKRIKKMRTALQQFSDSVNEAFAAVNTSLDNIVADETTLAAQIADLNTKITGLDPDEQAALDAVVSAAQAMAARSKSIADNVPDTVAPPATT